MIRKTKDEENLSRLRSTLEEAFLRFKVCHVPPCEYATFSGCYRQMESHIRMEKALDTLLTDAELGA
jgi:hypothetical protein